MNLEEQILTEHSKSNIDFIVAYIGNDPGKFDALLELFFEGSYRVVQRSAWVMSGSVSKYPQLVYPYLDRLIHNLEKKDNHDAVKRNSLKVLEEIEVPSIYHGELVSISFDFLADKKEPVGVKMYAMCILFKLTRNEPDLQKELRIIIEDQMPYASPGFKSRGSKILKALRKSSINRPT